MLRRAFRRFRRAIARAGTRMGAGILVRAMALGGEGRLLRGNGWVGCWSGDSSETVDISALSSRVDRIYDDVAARICSDWNLSKPRRKPPVLLGNAESLGALFRRLDLTRMESADAWRTRGVCWNGLVVAVGDRASDAFRDTLSHEMCHGLCETLLHSEHACYWADEGYANYVAQLTSPEPEQRYNSMLAELLWLRENDTRHLSPGGQATCLSIQDLLNVKQGDFGCRVHYTHATVFVCFLRSLRELEPRAWELLRTGLTASHQDHPLDEIAVRITTGFSLEELQREFDAYCARQAKRFGCLATQEQIRHALSTPTDN
jgi:hypothetical protein